MYSYEDRMRAVIELCSREGSAATVAADFGVERPTLYAWKRELLGEEDTKPMDRPNVLAWTQQRDALPQALESLQKRIHRLQLEHDILKKANELLKKDEGINLQILTNREKTVLIDALRTTYRLPELVHQLKMPPVVAISITPHVLSGLRSIRNYAVPSRKSSRQTNADMGIDASALFWVAPARASLRKSSGGSCARSASRCVRDDTVGMRRTRAK